MASTMQQITGLGNQENIGNSPNKMGSSVFCREKMKKGVFTYGILWFYYSDNCLNLLVYPHTLDAGNISHIAGNRVLTSKYT